MVVGGGRRGWARSDCEGGKRRLLGWRKHAFELRIEGLSSAITVNPNPAGSLKFTDKITRTALFAGFHRKMPPERCPGARSPQFARRKTSEPVTA